MSREPGLEIKKLSVCYDDNRVIEEVSFAVRPGRMTGLIGPNGVGKSTLLKTALGLVEKTCGDIFLDGIRLEDVALPDRARLMAYAAQGAPVHWPLTVEKMVMLGRLPHMDSWQRIQEEDRQAVERALDMTDSLHLKDRIVTTLSGGERACAMLARTIATDAPYLLVDEPVASLDPAHQLQVMTILRKLALRGHGVLIVLHDLNLGRRFCDDLVLLHDGRILADGEPVMVLSDANLAAAYGISAVRFEVDGEEFIVPRGKTGC